MPIFFRVPGMGRTVGISGWKEENRQVHMEAFRLLKDTFSRE
ncbi:hypothetical protein [Thermoactinomyces mirandus]|nr:hypothetical protein [Thermoactinomyces mirandus]